MISGADRRMAVTLAEMPFHSVYVAAGGPDCAAFPPDGLPIGKPEAPRLRERGNRGLTACANVTSPRASGAQVSQQEDAP